MGSFIELFLMHEIKSAPNPHRASRQWGEPPPPAEQQRTPGDDAEPSCLWPVVITMCELRLIDGFL